MTKKEQALLDALTKIRDSTFRDAASLRAIADDTINRAVAGDYDLCKVRVQDSSSSSEPVAVVRADFTTDDWT